MQLRQFQIDAFTNQAFGGNPAAVIPLQQWLSADLMQQIALENQLSETVFFVPEPADCDFAIRWFTPTAEVELCGHATLASAWWLFEYGQWNEDAVRFSSRSGPLRARRAGGGVTIDLPARTSQEDCGDRQALEHALGAEVQALYRGANLMAVLANQATLRDLRPDFRALAAFHPLGVIATAPGEDCDVVSRYFAPSFGIDEDPVTGSAHCDLAPYWSQRLGRTHFQARQLSARGGDLDVHLDGDRVLLTGDCYLFSRGEILLPD